MTAFTALEKSLQQILASSVNNQQVFGTAFALKTERFAWEGAAGNLTTTQPYFLASTTKLFTTALILQLQAAGKLQLDDKIGQYLPAEILQGLHVYKGKDHSGDITISQLLAHRSGLPDYFQGKGPSGKSLEDELLAGQDQAWVFENAISRAKTIKPLFAPGTKGKAQYADTNFQLLGRIIEEVTGQSYTVNCQQNILQPLGLSSTYLYHDPTDNTPQTLYYKSKPLHIPKAMAAFGPDGSMVSTSADMLVFIEAFFTGKLFPAAYLADLQQWNRIFFPMQSGIGIHLFKLPWLLNPTGAVPSFIGHSGLSGALAYYSPQHKLFIAGTVNQVAYPDRSFRTMIKLVQRVKKHR
jgi:CubicO group peptidase (beta-lactamase class C family)